MLRAAVLTGLLCAGAAEAASFELKIAAPCGETDKAYVLAGTSHEYCFKPGAKLDGAGVARIERYPVIAKVVIEFTPAGADKFLAAATEATGGGIGILFNDQLISYAQVGEPVRLEKITLSFTKTPELADALVEAFPGPKS
jgi:hypothetical protein